MYSDSSAGAWGGNWLERISAPKTNSGVVNVIGEIPVFISFSGKNGLLGPNPTELISMSGLILCAIIMLIKLQNEKMVRA